MPIWSTILVSESVHITPVALCTGTSCNDSASHVSHEYHAHDNSERTLARALTRMSYSVGLRRVINPHRKPVVKPVFRHLHDIIYAILLVARNPGNSHNLRILFNACPLVLSLDITSPYFTSLSSFGSTFYSYFITTYRYNYEGLIRSHFLFGLRFTSSLSLCLRSVINED